MSQTKKRRNRGMRARIDNSLVELAAGIRAFTAPETGGSDLSNYGTIAYSNNAALITLNWTLLSYFYVGNGIFQRAIRMPIQDALSKGIEIESDEISPDDSTEILNYCQDNQTFQKIVDAWTWVRLFGGGALIVNTNDDPSKPMTTRTLPRTPIDFIPVDRWQLSSTGNYTDFDDWFLNGDKDGMFWLHGIKVHKSRVIRARGMQGPTYIKRQLRGWGLSDAERMIRDLNLYLKTQNVLYEIIDEAKVDVYHIKGLANKLAQSGGTEVIRNRVQRANEIKSYINALVLDMEENYEQKSMSFAGLAEVMRENRLGIASSLSIPMTKLFGLSASGFNAGEDDLENYNAMIESDVRKPLEIMIRQVLDVVMSHKWGYIPEYRIKYPSLRVMSDIDQETVNTSKQNRVLSLYDRGLLSTQEVGKMLEDLKVLVVPTMMAEGKLPPQATPPMGGQFGSTLPDPPSKRSRDTPETSKEIKTTVADPRKGVRPETPR
jgi:phage-related protein (TIGR01555 family)